MISCTTADNSHLLQGLKLLSYVPIALFAESLWVQSAVLSSICSTNSVAPAVTGCIKDLKRLWNLDYFELFGSFETGKSSVVSSIRNGNTFPLVNQGFLELANIVGRKPAVSTLNHARPVSVSVTFVAPRLHPYTLARSPWFWLCRCLNAFQLMLHLVLTPTLAVYGLHVGCILMGCLSAIDILHLILRHATKAIFSKPGGTDGNVLPLARHSALDVQIVASSWNTSHLDVLAGTSVQLHALTNIPIRLSRPKVVLWTLRILATILVIQAAALTSLIGADCPEVWASFIWLCCYLLMLLPAQLIRARAPALALEDQPGDLNTSSSISFSNRSAALAFIARLPVDQRDHVGFSWMDGFIPPNARRKKWVEDLYRSSLFQEEDPDDIPDAMRLLVKEVKSHFYDAAFQHRLRELTSKRSNV